jgi:hypothetical protein
MMKAKIRYISGGDETVQVNKVYLYRMLNGCLLIRLDINSKFAYEVDHGTTETDNVMELDIELRTETGNFTLVTICPVTSEDIALFKDCYFLKKLYRYRVHYIVCPAVDDIEPEEIPIDEE